MNTGRALTLADTYFYSADYVGNIQQKFMVVSQADGSVGIRSYYQDLALTM